MIGAERVAISLTYQNSENSIFYHSKSGEVSLGKQRVLKFALANRIQERSHVTSVAAAAKLPRRRPSHLLRKLTGWVKPQENLK